MIKLKKSRSSFRREMTRLCGVVDAIITAADVDQDSLKVKLESLKRTQESLNEKDDAIKDLMIDADDVTDEQMDAELTEVTKYQELCFSTRLRIEKKLVPPQPDIPTAGPGSHVTDLDKMKANFRLPKMELRKFNGDLKQWLGWWSQFKKIHENEEIDSTDKFNYLSQCMESGSEAAEMLNGYPPTGDNYLEAVKALSNRFGREELLLQVYVRELLTLVISNVTSKDKIPLSTLFMKLESHLRCLAALNLDKADPATWLYPLVESSLSEDILRAWQRSSFSKEDGSTMDPPRTKLDQLMSFIQNEVEVDQQISLAQAGFQCTTLTNKKKNKKPSLNLTNDEATVAGLMTGQKSNCVFCDKTHESDRSVKAQSMTMEARQEKIKEKRACFNCLVIGHGSKKCKTLVQCNICKGKHYPIMCKKNQGATPDLPKEEKVSPPMVTASSSSASNQCSSDVLLNTLKVQIVGRNKVLNVRVVGDTGSQRSYICRKVVEDAGCEKTGQEWLQNILFGGSTTNPSSFNKYEVLLRPMKSTYVTKLDLLCQAKICGKLPKIPHGPWVSELLSEGIEISDLGTGCFDVDILLGNDHWSSILTGKMIKLTCGLVAIETVLGWTLGGRVPKQTNNHAMMVTSLLSTSSDISFLWSLETIGITDPIEPQSNEDLDLEATEKFNKTVSRNEIGQFTVCLPWKNENMKPPTNRLIAEKRLRYATTKLNNQNKFKDYDNVLKMWESKGFIRRMTVDEEGGHYLPHRPVFKNSTTTPVRPVFDASCKSKNSPSLNDCLHKGPNLLDLIPSLFLRFREHRIGVTSDISKAFLTIFVDKSDQVYQKFLWWEDSSCEKMIVFKHVRVMFGVNCSPFLLAAVIQYLLRKIENSEVVPVLSKSFYVDNCVTSLSTIKGFDDFKKESTLIMSKAGMNLRQWAHTITQERGLNQQKPIFQDDDSIETEICISVLGYSWDREKDTISCKIEDFLPEEKITKQNILSTVAKMFDPIGFICPVMVLPKVMLQQSWAQKINWDDVLPEESSEKFKAWVRQLPTLKDIQIPRWFQVNSNSEKELHVFCDASKYAYAAVVFLRSEYNGVVQVQLLLAKSRLAPVKSSTIPRLELMSCYVGSKLAASVKSSLNYGKVITYYWTDSKTAEAWIKRRGDYGVFVANRVKKILEVSSSDQWNHVPGVLNPADLPSRGCSPLQLLESKWWEGPDWLHKSKENWPDISPLPNEDEVRSEYKKTAVFVSLSSDEKLTFSSYRKNVAVYGWVLRFIAASRGKQIEKKKYITMKELRQAEVLLIKQIQEKAFPNHVEKLGNIMVVRDNMGLLRVKTRLTNRMDTKDFIYPILLPNNHPLVEQMILDMHRFFYHGGLQFLVTKTREKYWILHTRRTIRRIIRKCTNCRRHAAQPLKVDPVALPERRVNDGVAFQTTGVDLAGPLVLRDGSKAWIVLYTCALYRGVYLDVVCSLSTEAFMNSLERFIGHHGRPNTIYSDNGTNFCGANNLFKQLDWDEIEKLSNVKQIHWIFNPVTASWYGGWWERLVRSVKDLLKRMLGRARISYDELRTCLAGVASTINDHPITLLTEESGDLIPLTPNMFLRPLPRCEFPETNSATTLQANYMKMKSLQKQIQDRFRKEYLAQLVMHSNNKKNQDDIKVGDVVLIGFDNKKRYEWPMGVIIELLPGRDKKIRMVKLKTAKGEMERPLQRIYPLEISTRMSQSEERKAIQQMEKDTLKTPEPFVTLKGRICKKPARYGNW